MNNIKAHKLFICLSVIFGLLLVFLVAPFQTPDENSHFKKAYVISKGQIFPSYKDGIYGFELPVNMTSYIDKCTENMGDRDAKVNYSEVVISDRLAADYGVTEQNNFSTADTNPFAHFIQAIGIVIGKIFWRLTRDNNGSAVYLLYFARIANLIFYTFIVAWAIKITPVLKKTMCAIALMPMSLSLAASCSYDALLVSLTCLSFAYIMNILLKKDEWYIEKRTLVLMIIVAFIMFAIKPYCALIYLLLFFTPKEKFKNNKDYIKKIFIFAGAVLGLYILFRIPGIVSTMKTNVVGGVDNSALQRELVLSNPLDFIKLVFNNFYVQRDYYIATTIGVLGLIDTYLPTAITTIYLIFIISIAIIEISCSEYKINIYTKLTVAFVIIVSLIGISYIMYVGWTSNLADYGVGSNTISGIQGRYFIPLLIPVWIIFSNSKLKQYKLVKRIESYFCEYHAIVYTSVLSLTVATVLLRFWI